MAPRFAYPANIELDCDGFFLVTFPDVPEAGTDDRDREVAMVEAVDSLVCALGGYIEADRDIPPPSRRRRGQQLLSLPPLVAAKLALYQTMREKGVTPAELAARLGIGERVVRRLLDLDRRSPLGQIEDALKALGKTLVMNVADAA